MKKLLAFVMVVVLILCVLSPLTAVCSAADSSIILVDLSAATDAELEDAVNRIKAEQRARLKTRIVLDAEELVISKGKSVKISAEITDIPEDLTASKIVWNSSDSKVASCNQGNVKGAGNGTAIITASCTLSDGTEISSECIVTVVTPITSLNTKTKKYDIGIGESAKTEITIQPKDATNTELNYTSSDDSVATVDKKGVITGVGTGTATIKATALDGTGKSVEFSVKSSKKDDRGKAKTDKEGNVFKYNGIKQTSSYKGLHPDNGNCFLWIDMEIENNTTEDRFFFSHAQSHIICDGMEIEAASIDLLTDTSMNGKLKAGKKTKGQILFEVPEGWNEIQLDIHVSLGTHVQFIIYNQ